MKYKHWNWLTVPGIEKRIGDAATIQQWIIAQRAAKKTFKAVLPATENTGSFNDEGIVEFATDNIKVGAKTYSVFAY